MILQTAAELYETLQPILEAEAVALALIGGIHCHDLVTKQRKLARLRSSAAILTGIQGQSIRRPKELWRALRAGSPDSLPGAARALVVCGVCVPIPGPVDEATALSTVLALCAVPKCRQIIRKAWKESAAC